MAVKGVDISEHNGSVDFQALQKAGIDFVIIRCGYGSDYKNQDDKRFSENVKKAESYGMPWGVYLYSYATNATMAKSEAQHVIRLLNGKKPLYGVWYDVEDPQLSNYDLVTTSQVFCDSMEAAGIYAGVYSMLSWMNSKLNSSKLDKYDKWIAQWSDSCDYKKPYGIWQYTDKLVIGGKAFDGNFAYKDYPSIIKGVHNTNPEEDNKEEEEMTEAQVKTIVEKAIADYFSNLANKEVSNWAKDHVETVKERGIMNGDTDGKFRPQSYITRQELAAVIVNALGIGKDPSEWAKEAFEKATESEVLDGTMPKEALTREQFAVILDKLGLIGE